MSDFYVKMTIAQNNHFARMTSLNLQLISGHITAADYVREKLIEEQQFERQVSQINRECLNIEQGRVVDITT